MNVVKVPAIRCVWIVAGTTDIGIGAWVVSTDFSKSFVCIPEKTATIAARTLLIKEGYLCYSERTVPPINTYLHVVAEQKVFTSWIVPRGELLSGEWSGTQCCVVMELLQFILNLPLSVVCV